MISCWRDLTCKKNATLGSTWLRNFNPLRTAGESEIDDIKKSQTFKIRENFRAESDYRIEIDLWIDPFELRT